MVNVIEYPQLNTVTYIPGEPFTAEASFLADEGDTPFSPDDPYTIRFDWRRNDAGAEYTTETETAVIATPRDDTDHGGIRLTLVVSSADTEGWPINTKFGVCRIMSGIGESAATIAVGEIRPSRFASPVVK